MDVIVYTKDDCKYCNMLKHWLKLNEIEFEEVDAPTSDKFQGMKSKYNLKTVPVLTIDDEIVSHEPYNNILEKLGHANSLFLNVEKRNGDVVSFNTDKIRNAILNANDETLEMTYEEVIDVLHFVVNRIKINDEDVINVEDIQDMVEEALMNKGHTKTAKAYILYRDKRANERKRDIFKPRTHFKPFEYPELEAYAEAIQHSYWLHTEYNYTSDVQHYKTEVNDAEREAIKRSMLAISQVEVAVKKFWGRLGDRLPKPELETVGAVFSESESRHSKAYAHLLELLGLNNEFEKIYDIPALNNRVKYLNKHQDYSRTGDNRDYVIAIALFSMFIEHVSLFSQFLIIMSFNKHKNLFPGVSNVIEATSKEEQNHGLFGIDLVNIIREERPEWFDKDMEDEILSVAREAYVSEMDLIDWIYELGDLDFMPKYDVKEFIKHRLNNSLEAIGYERIFDEDEDAVKRTEWFDIEVIATKHVDFFAKR